VSGPSGRAGRSDVGEGGGRPVVDATKATVSRGDATSGGGDTIGRLQFLVGERRRRGGSVAEDEQMARRCSRREGVATCLEEEDGDVSWADGVVGSAGYAKSQLCRRDAVQEKRNKIPWRLGWGEKKRKVRGQIGEKRKERLEADFKFDSMI
jgi:hypothetical protein